MRKQTRREKKPAPTVTCQFPNWDDNYYVYENPCLGTLDLPFLGWAFTNTCALHRSPLLWLRRAELSGEVPAAVLLEARRLAGAGRVAETIRLFEGR